MTSLGISLGLTASRGGGDVALGELITNGDFSDGTAGWTADGCDISIVDGKLQIDNLTGSIGYVRASIAASFGMALTLSYTAAITDGTAIRVALNNGGRNSGSDNVTGATDTARSFLFAQTVASTEIEIIVFGDATTVATIDDLSLINMPLGDEVIPDPSFDSGITGWLFQANTSISHSAGQLDASSSDTASSYAYRNITVENGETYIVATKVDNANTRFVAFPDQDLTGSDVLVLDDGTLERAGLFEGDGSVMSVGIRPKVWPLNWAIEEMSVRKVITA